MEMDRALLLQNFGEIVIDFGEICRFCLLETNNNISIQDRFYESDSTEIQPETICSFMRKLCQIKIQENKNLPSLVCENCFELVRTCFTFIQVCKQSDLSLRECYEKTLNETKAKLNYNEEFKEGIPDVPPEPKTKEVSVQIDLPVTEKEIPHQLELGENSDNKKPRELKWKLRPKLKDSISILKADNIKQKYQRMNSLSERLKEAQSKLAEDILRSNDMMLGLPKNDELSKALHGFKSLYNCPQCSLTFNNPEALKFHYVGTHGQIRKISNVKFQCRKCIMSFTRQEKLVSHYEKIHQIPKCNLSEEDINFKVKESVRMGKRKFYCLHCVPYKVFQKRDQLVEHLNEGHKENENSKKGKIVCKFYVCTHCNNDITFSSKFSLNRHLRTVHKMKRDEITSKDVKYIPKTEPQTKKEELTNPTLRLFKIFVCTDCSPPVSFINIDACMQHKTEVHDKQLENIPENELTPIYVDSMGLFKQSKDDTSLNFKVLCKNCDPPMEFTSASSFVNHMFSSHKESTLENWDIESKIAELDGLKNEQTWKCSECSASYIRRTSLYYHMKDKHNKTLSVGELACPEPGCDETFFTNRQLIQHGISVHEKYFAHSHKIFKKNILETSNEKDIKHKNFECDICQKKYVCKNSLKRHIRKTHFGKVDTESVECVHCGKILSNKLNLKSHIEFVHEALFVSCPVCGKKINFRTIGKHYKTHQTEPSQSLEKQFLCNLCGKILKSKRGFEDHQKLHTNVRDQLCDICGTGFLTKKILHLHKKTHDGNHKKVFECHLCEKVFSGRHTLNRHILTHSGEKNYVCEICSKCFYTRQELNRHIRYHKKEYRFDCQLCEMRFLDKSRFRQHMMRHRNIRPHKCQFCDKMFIVKRKMNLHMAAKHNVEVQNTKAVWKDPKTYIPLDALL